MLHQTGHKGGCSAHRIFSVRQTDGLDHRCSGSHCNGAGRGGQIVRAVCLHAIQIALAGFQILIIKEQILCTADLLSVPADDIAGHLVPVKGHTPAQLQGLGVQLRSPQINRLGFHIHGHAAGGSLVCILLVSAVEEICTHYGNAVIPVSLRRKCNRNGRQGTPVCGRAAVHAVQLQCAAVQLILHISVAGHLLHGQCIVQRQPHFVGGNVHFPVRQADRKGCLFPGVSGCGADVQINLL